MVNSSFSSDLSHVFRRSVLVCPLRLCDYHWCSLFETAFCWHWFWSSFAGLHGFCDTPMFFACLPTGFRDLCWHPSVSLICPVIFSVFANVNNRKHDMLFSSCCFGRANFENDPSHAHLCVNELYHLSQVTCLLLASMTEIKSFSNRRNSWSALLQAYLWQFLISFYFA